MPPLDLMLARLSRLRARRAAVVTIALVLFGLALGGRFLLGSVLPTAAFPFLTFFPAVLLSALIAGLWPALLVSALSVASAWFFFLPPVFSFKATTLTDAVALTFFGGVLAIDCVVVHAMMLAFDRTRAAEQGMERLTGELRGRVEELQQARDRQASARTQAEAARLAAEDAVREKNRAMTRVGHDLRQPLQAISASLDLLARLSNEPVPGAGALDASRRVRAEQALARAQRNVASLAEAFDSLLEASRIESQAFRPSLVAFCVDDVLQRVADEFHASAREARVMLRIDACPLVALSDRELVLSMLRNLVSNAIKYTPGGTVTVACRRPPGERTVIVEVTDTGIGIPPEHQQHVFEAFSRLAPDMGPGMGLGLSLVRKTADLLSLPLYVDSAPGRGSRFGFRLPLADRTVSQAA